MTMAPEGGITGPRELAAISTVAASSEGNPVFFIVGMVMTPMAAALPGPVPERAPMAALARMAT